METATAGKLERLYHSMPRPLPDMVFRAGKTFVIGRTDNGEADVREREVIVCSSEFVSRKHCEITYKNGAFWVMDLKSLNGTFLNGVKLLERVERELRFGDLLGIGVSNSAKDVNIEGPEYFIFKFQVHQFEVIDLDGEDEDIIVEVPMSVSPRRDFDDDVVEILEMESADRPLKLSPISSEAKKMPPPPPPPVIRVIVSSPPDPKPSTSPPTSVKAADNPATSPAKPAGSSKGNDEVVSSIDFKRPGPACSKRGHGSKSPTPSGCSSHGTTRQMPTPLPRLTPKNLLNEPIDPFRSHRVSVDTATSDDSSDGLSETLSSQKFIENVESSPDRAIQVSEDEEMDQDLENRPSTSAAAIQFNSKNLGKQPEKAKGRPLKDLSPSPTKYVKCMGQQLRVNTNNIAVKTMLKKKTVVSLKQLFVKNAIPGFYCMTKKKHHKFTEENIAKICRQFNRSRKKFSSSSTSSSSSSSEQGGDSSVAKKRKVSYNSSSEDSHHKRKRVKSVDSSDAEDDFSRETLREKKEGSVSKSRGKKETTPPSSVSTRKKQSDSSSSDENAGLRTHPNTDKDNQHTVRSPSPLANVSSNAITPKANLPRRTMVINTAPMPREFVYRQARKNKFEEKREERERDRQEQVFSDSKRDEVPCDWKELRKKKLKEVEANKKREREKAGVSVEVDKPKVHVNAKVTNRSRSQGLIESIIGPETVQKELQRATSIRNTDVTAPSSPSSTSTATTTVTSEPKKLPPPQREIPIPSALLEAQMPLNHIRNLQQRYASNVESEASARKRIPPSVPVINDSRALMQKPGVAASSDSTHKNDNVTFLDYHHGKPSATSRVRKDSNPSRSNQMACISTEEAYKTIVRWNPQWLIEQEKCKDSKPPPVAEGYETVRTLYEYSDFKTYFEVFFPLILHEIWASITKDFKTPQGSSRDRDSEPGTEFDVVVLNITSCNYCPMLSRSYHEPSSVKDANATADTWTQLQCQVLTKRAAEMSNRKDLAILKLPKLEPTGKEQAEKQYREFFGFVLTKTETTVKIDNSVIPHPLLRAKHPQAQFLHSMTIAIRACNFGNFDMASLGTIKRITYISSKLRDIKAVNRMIKSEMGKHIVGLKPPTDIFDLTIIPSQHRVIPHVYKLNHKQRSVIGHVCEKLKSPESQLMLLHGPPGTGKTVTIVALILQILLTTEFCRNGQEPRVLVCTPSNTAIDEIMRRVDSELKNLPAGGKTISMIRVGETESSPAPLKRYAVDELARKYEQSNSKIASIEAAIKQCNKEIADKRAEIESFEKMGGSKATLESLKRELKDIDSRRKEHQEDVSKNRRDKSNHNENKGHVLNRANLVCTTLNSCSNSLMCNVFGENAYEKYKKKRPFLCCIVDEASQTTEPETLAPFLLQVDKLLLVGDPYQLGATVLSSEATKRGYDLSLFARLNHYYKYTVKTPRAVMMLTDQYRMDPEILAWPNDYFYKGHLQTHCVRIKSNERSNKLRPYLFLNLPSLELSNDKGQISNEDEASLVVAIIANLWKVLQMETDTVKKCTVGVITPYAEQRNVLRAYLYRDLKQAACTVEVDTVDSFQGREKDIIVLSCVRTESTGFLKSSLRLNVALTRAKLSLIIVGDAKCLEKDAMWKSLIEDARDRECICDIPTDYKSNPGFLKQRLYTALSPTKKPKPD